MFNFLKNLFAKSDSIEKPDYLLSLSRSPLWYSVRKEFLKETGEKCAACGLRTNLEVHHIIPFHVRPDLELDKTNLITLCENKSIACHFVIGHSFDWKAYNINVIPDAKTLSIRKETRLYKDYSIG